MGSDKLQLDRWADFEPEFHENCRLDDTDVAAMVQPDRWDEVDFEFQDNCRLGEIESLFG